MTLCGTSTGVLLPPILKDFLKHVMIDGVVSRCLFMVIGYRQYLRENYNEKSSNFPTIAQILLTATILGRRQYVYSSEAQRLIDNYTNDLTKQAEETTSSQIGAFLAKQPLLILRISALTHIIDIIPKILQNIKM